MPLEILILGALMGILGQGARAVAGLKGMSDDAKAMNVDPEILFDAVRLLVSFLIGILVGLASALVYLKGFDKIDAATWPEWTTMLGWAVTAYAGTDFLESFISQYLSPTLKTKTLDSKVSDLDLKVTSLDTKLSTIAQQPPAAPAAIDPETIVHKAFAVLGHPILNAPNIPNDSTKLTDPPFSWDNTDTQQYWGLLVAVNTQLYNIDPTLPVQKRPTMADSASWQNASTTVGNVVTSVTKRLAS